MQPGAIARFHAAQSSLIDQTYLLAWQQGVASYAPAPRLSRREAREREEAAQEAEGAAAALLFAQSRGYRSSDVPDAQAQANATKGSKQSLEKMVGELMALRPTPEHVAASAELVHSGEILGHEAQAHAEALAAQDWLDSNEWRLGAGDSVAWTGEQDGYSQAANADGQLLEWLPEADDRVCGDCEQLGDLPPMPLSDWPTIPGAGDTICNAGCRCVMQVSDEQLGLDGELQALSDKQEAFVSDLAEGREPYAEGPYTPPEGALVGNVELGERASVDWRPDENQTVHTHAELYAQAKETKPLYDELLTKTGRTIGADVREFKQALTGEDASVILAPLKDGKEGGRAFEKVEGKYEGDWGRLKDVVRGTIVVPAEADLAGAVEAVQRAVAAEPGWRIVATENRYTFQAGSRWNTGANGFGYRDVSMHLIAPNGHVTELQINTNAMMRAKELGGGHQLYESVRSILERDRALPRTEAERALVDKVTRESQELYGKAEQIARPLKGVADMVVKEVRDMDTDTAAQALFDGTVKDTQKRYTIGGHLRADREALHKDIVARLLAPHARQAHPEALFTAGGPASGKSWFRTAPGAPPDAVIIDPDEIRKLLPDYNEIMELGRADIASSATHEEASQIAKDLTLAASKTGRNIIVDGVGDSAPGKFAAKIQQAVDAGYKTQVRYMHLSTPEAIRREALRAAKSGRKVPRDVLTSKHAEVSARYQEVLKVKGVHRVSLWDNGVAKGEDPKLVSDKGSGKLKVYDEHVQREFEAKAAELRTDTAPVPQKPEEGPTVGYHGTAVEPATILDEGLNRGEGNLGAGVYLAKEGKHALTYVPQGGYLYRVDTKGMRSEPGEFVSRKAVEPGLIELAPYTKAALSGLPSSDFSPELAAKIEDSRAENTVTLDEVREILDVLTPTIADAEKAPALYFLRRDLDEWLANFERYGPGGSDAGR